MLTFEELALVGGKDFKMGEQGTQIQERVGLIKSFSVGKGDVISFVGGGGKTTTLLSMWLELRRKGYSVIVTSTTHMQSQMILDAQMPPLVLTWEQDNWLDVARSHLVRLGSVTVLGRHVRNDKISGIKPSIVDSLRKLADCVLIEADGARGRSLKAPAEHEPVVAAETTLMVVVVGIDAVGSPLDDKNVHRLEVVGGLSRLTKGMLISEEAVADTLAGGYLRKVPRKSRCLCFINKVDEKRRKIAESVGELLVDRGFTEVVFGQGWRPQSRFYCIGHAKKWRRAGA